VLSQLLHGSGYNVMMIGDLGQGTPRQIVLSSRQRGETQNIATKSAASNNDDEDTDNEEQPQPQTQPLVPVPNRPAIVPVIPHALRSRSCRKCSSASSNNSLFRSNRTVVSDQLTVFSAD